MVAIIDYGAGNLSSVKKALDFLGAESEITQDKEKILSASHVILPGVGSFGDAMASMKEFRFLAFAWDCSFCLKAVMKARVLRD